jgi:hypothetical protein
MHYPVVILRLFLLGVFLMPSLTAYEEAWITDDQSKRSWYRDAMRHNPNGVILLEYRWLSKPTGQFGNEVNKDASYSLAKQETLTAGGNDYELRAKYKNLDYWLALRVIVALDKNDPQAELLTKPESLEALSLAYRTLFDQFPTDEQRKHRRWPLLKLDLQQYPSALFRSSLTPLQCDQYSGSQFGGFSEFFYPPVLDWYQNQGAPYVKVPHVVFNVWFWHDYIPQSKVKAYVEGTTKGFEEANAAAKQKIKMLDVRQSVE